MRLLCIIFALTLVSAQANAETLRLAANVNNEELAEETVSLLRCLSEKKGVPWEFTGEVGGSHWLKVREYANKLRGTYLSGKEETSFEMNSGEAEAVCERLAPETEKIDLAPPLEAETAFPEISVSEKKNYWPWAAGIGAAALAAFFILKHSGPDHRALTMN